MNVTVCSFNLLLSSFFFHSVFWCDVIRFPVLFAFPKWFCLTYFNVLFEITCPYHRGNLHFFGTLEIQHIWILEYTWYLAERNIISCCWIFNLYQIFWYFPIFSSIGFSISQNWSNIHIMKKLSWKLFLLFFFFFF